jgi:hypothetical protein
MSVFPLLQKAKTPDAPITLNDGCLHDQSSLRSGRIAEPGQTTDTACKLK